MSTAIPVATAYVPAWLTCCMCTFWLAALYTSLLLHLQIFNSTFTVNIYMRVSDDTDCYFGKIWRKGTIIKININKYQHYKYLKIDMQGVWRVLEHVHIFWIDWHVIKLNIYQNSYSIFLRGMKMCLPPFEKSVKRAKTCLISFLYQHLSCNMSLDKSTYSAFTTCKKYIYPRKQLSSFSQL